MKIFQKTLNYGVSDSLNIIILRWTKKIYKFLKIWKVLKLCIVKKNIFNVKYKKIYFRILIKLFIYRQLTWELYSLCNNS